MSASQRRKGHNYEREVAKQLRRIFPDACRHLEYQAEQANGVDIDNTGALAFQVKRHKGYVPVNRINEIQDKTRIPVLVTKGDKLPAMAVLPFSDLVKILADVGVAYEYDPPPF